MTEIKQLVTTLKRQLKAQGLTYRDVATALELSEPSVKRLFASQRLTVDRLAQLSQLLGFTLAELLAESSASMPQVRMLSNAQETQLVSDIKLLLVAVCAFNHWSLTEIVATYRMSKAECLKRLLLLERMGVIELLPGDRVRLRVARDFDWIPNGPIQDFFVRQEMGDFLRNKFTHANESIEFSHGMLTESAAAQFQQELRRLRSKLSALHQESAAAPLQQKCGTGVLIATREWEPLGFQQLRRSPIA